MTPELLKQAREALWGVAQELHHIDAGPVKELGGVIAKVEDAATALTAFDSISEYDKAIHALATYLPDGWVAQDADGGIHWTLWQTEPISPVHKDHSVGWWLMHGEEPDDYRALHLETPACQDWRDSLRRITHNDGTVTVERG